MGLEDLFIDVTSLPQNGYGFFQLLTLCGFYGYGLCLASNMISDGSELLLLVPSLAGLVGSVVLPVLGAVPDGCIVLFSGLGENAAEEVDVGIGALAGSTIMLLTIPWFLSVVGGRVNIDPVSGPKYKLPKLTPPDFFHLDNTGVSVAPSVNAGSGIMIVTALSYLLIQIPSIFYSTPDAQAAGTANWALASLLVCLGLFIWYLYYQYNLSDDDLEGVKEEEALVKGITDGNITLIGVMYHELKDEFGDDPDVLTRQYSGASAAADEQQSVPPPEPASLISSFSISRLIGGSSSDERAPLSIAAVQNRYSSSKLIASQSAMNRLRRILKPFFKKYDADNSGSLEVGEVVAVFRDLGETATLKELESIFSKMDKDKSGDVDFNEFVIGVADYVLNNKAFKKQRKALAEHDVEIADAMSAKPQPAEGEEEEEEEEEEEDVPEDLADLSPEEQQRQIKARSFWLMGLGTVIVVLLSDPMVSVLNEIGKRTSIPAFYISFVLAPLASNASEVIASYNYALKKTSQSIAISLSALEGACIMNNTFVMGIFMYIMYAKGLLWKYSAETLSILFVIAVVAIFAQKKAHTIRDAFYILSLYPVSLLLVAFLEHIGWD